VTVILVSVKEMFLTLYTAWIETDFMKSLVTEVNVCHVIVWKIKWHFHGCWNHASKCNFDKLLKIVPLCGTLLLNFNFLFFFFFGTDD